MPSNSALGYVKDDINILLLLVDYLKKDNEVNCKN